MLDRLKERTSWNGGALIAVGLIILVAGPLANIAAYAAIAYGIMTMEVHKHIDSNLKQMCSSHVAAHNQLSSMISKQI